MNVDPAPHALVQRRRILIADAHSCPPPKEKLRDRHKEKESLR